jgi:hypothetical protein
VNFSESSATVNWAAAAASLALVAVYVVAAVLAGRRFGTPGLWAVWFAGIVAGSSLPFLMHGESFAHFDRAAMLFHTAILAVPLGISAWVINRTLRRPRPAGIPAQLALGALSLVLSFVAVAIVAFAVMDYTVSRRYPL